MNKKVADRAFALLLLLFVLGFTAMALQLNTTARRMPVMVAVFTLICLLAYFAGEFWPRGAKAPSKPKAAKPLEEGKVKAHDALNWYDWRVWGWLLLLGAAVYFGGITLGIGITTVAFYRLAAKGSWRAAIVFGILQMAFFYVVFEIAFKEVLFRGMIYEWLFP